MNKQERKEYAEGYKERRNQLNRNKAQGLSNSYIKRLLCEKYDLKPSQVNQEIIDLKREHLKLYRLIKEESIMAKKKEVSITNIKEMRTRTIATQNALLSGAIDVKLAKEIIKGDNAIMKSLALQLKYRKDRKDKPQIGFLNCQ